MFNIFEKMVSDLKEVATAEKPVITVEQVHKEFFTASDDFMKDMNDFMAQRQSDKAKRLMKFGMSMSRDVVESTEYRKKSLIAKVIEKYAISHPLNKIITDTKVKEICKKYNLLQGEPWRFKGFVPEKNLKEMEQFKRPTTGNYIIVETGYMGVPDVYEKYIHAYVPEEKTYYTAFLTQEEAQSWIDKYGDKRQFPETRPEPTGPMSICAPVKDMHLNYGDKIVGNQIVVPDPIVLQKVEQDCYLIVTAWGDEASDPEVLNEKMN